MKTEPDYIKELLEQEEKELAKCRVMEWMFTLEAVNPKHMGKQKAEENVGIYQKHATIKEQNILVYKNYLKEKYPNA